jgi:hypothetical protein
MWVFLVTHPHLTMLGAMRATATGLAEELAYGQEGLVEAYVKAFQEVLAKDKVKYDPKAALVWLPNFLRYNRPESPNVVKSWPEAFDLLPECDMKVELFRHVKAFAQGLTESFRKAFAEAFTEDFAKTMPNQEQEQEQEQEKLVTHPSFPLTTLSSDKRVSVFNKSITSARPCAVIDKQEDLSSSSRNSESSENSAAQVSFAEIVAQNFEQRQPLRDSLSGEPRASDSEQTPESGLAAGSFALRSRVENSFTSELDPNVEKNGRENSQNWPSEGLGGAEVSPMPQQSQSDPVAPQQSVPGNEEELSVPGYLGSTVDEQPDELVKKIIETYPRRADGYLVESTLIERAARHGATLQEGLLYLLERTRMYREVVLRAPPRQRRWAYMPQRFFGEGLYEQEPEYWELGDDRGREDVLAEVARLKAGGERKIDPVLAEAFELRRQEEQKKNARAIGEADGVLAPPLAVGQQSAGGGEGVGGNPASSAKRPPTHGLRTGTGGPGTGAAGRGVRPR